MIHKSLLNSKTLMCSSMLGNHMEAKISQRSICRSSDRHQSAFIHLSSAALGNASGQAVDMGTEYKSTILITSGPMS